MIVHGCPRCGPHVTRASLPEQAPRTSSSMPGTKRIALGMVGPGLVGGELLRQLEATKVPALHLACAPRCGAAHALHASCASGAPAACGGARTRAGAACADACAPPSSAGHSQGQRDGADCVSAILRPARVLLLVTALGARHRARRGGLGSGAPCSARLTRAARRLTQRVDARARQVGDFGPQGGEALDDLPRVLDHPGAGPCVRAR